MGTPSECLIAIGAFCRHRKGCGRLNNGDLRCDCGLLKAESDLADALCKAAAPVSRPSEAETRREPVHGCNCPGHITERKRLKWLLSKHKQNEVRLVARVSALRVERDNQYDQAVEMTGRALRAEDAVSALREADEKLRKIVSDLLGRLSDSRPLNIGSMDSHRTAMYGINELDRLRAALQGPEGK